MEEYVFYRGSGEYQISLTKGTIERLVRERRVELPLSMQFRERVGFNENEKVYPRVVIEYFKGLRSMGDSAVSFFEDISSKDKKWYNKVLSFIGVSKPEIDLHIRIGQPQLQRIIKTKKISLNRENLDLKAEVKS